MESAVMTSDLLKDLKEKNGIVTSVEDMMNVRDVVRHEEEDIEGKLKLEEEKRKQESKPKFSNSIPKAKIVVARKQTTNNVIKAPPPQKIIPVQKKVEIKPAPEEKLIVKNDVSKPAEEKPMEEEVQNKVIDTAMDDFDQDEINSMFEDAEPKPMNEVQQPPGFISFDENLTDKTGTPSQH